jgi:hypothetical protein
MLRRQRTLSSSESLFSSTEYQDAEVPKHKKDRHEFTPSSSTEGSSLNQVLVTIYHDCGCGV